MVGFTVYFEFSKYLAHKKVESLIQKGFPSQHKLVFTFSQHDLKELKWVNKNEFRLGDHLFDVIKRRELPSGKMELQCFADVHEDALYAHFSFTMGKDVNDTSSSSPLVNVFKAMHTPVLLELSSYYLLEEVKIKLQIHNFYYSRSFSEASLRQIEHPPSV
jgi:hypothetical protein